MATTRRFCALWMASFGTAALALMGSPAPVSLAPPASAAPASAAPVFAKSVDIAPVKGKATVSLPGHRSVDLNAPRQVPVGTTVNAASATVRVTASDGKGGTYSGRFGDGGFVVKQSASGGGATEIKVVGECVKDAASDVWGATEARRPRHKPPLFRQLEVQASGRFEVVGSNASAVASGQAAYSLTDQCDGTHIMAQAGHVNATGTIQGTIPLHAHESVVDDCQPSAAAPAQCILLVGRPQSSSFAFGLLLANASASSFQVCYTTPGGRRICHVGPLGPPNSSPEGGSLACTVNDGRGDYAARWLVNGRQVGVTHHFKVTQPRDFVLGNDSCYGSSLNVN